MVGYGGKLDYHDQPRPIKTRQDQPRSNQGQQNENQSLALIVLALFAYASIIAHRIILQPGFQLKVDFLNQQKYCLIYF